MKTTACSFLLPTIYIRKCVFPYFNTSKFRLCIEGETKLKINTRLSRWRDYHVTFLKTFHRFPNFIKVEKFAPV